MNRMGIWVGVLLLGGAMFFAVAARADSASDAGAGLHKRLDAKALGVKLQKFRMGALLEALADETQDGQLKIEALLFQADTVAPEQRDALLTKAAEGIKTEYEALGKKLEALPQEKRQGDEFDESLIAYFKLRLRYVQVQALERGKPYIDRLLFLLGGEQDRQALKTLTDKATDLLAKTQRDLDFEIGDAREDTDKTKMVYLVPELEDLQSQVEFTAGKLLYYTAIAQPKTIKDKDGKTIPNPTRVSLLGKSVRDLQRFVEEPEYGVQSFAMLQQGRANRALGKYAEAGKQLAWAAGDQADKSVLVEALFEIVRNETEHAGATMRDEQRADRVSAGKQGFARAEKALSAFAQRTPEVHPELGVEIKVLVLSHYLYEQWAEALRAVGQANQAGPYEKKSQQAFLAFLDKYKDPGIQAAVGRLFRDKFRGKDIDVKNLAPGIVLLLATMEMQDAMALLGGRTVDALDPQAKAQAEKHLAKAEELLLVVRDSKAPDAQKALPDTLWKLGVLYVRKNQNFQAGEMFRQLVRDFPKHERARDASLNAVKIANQLVASQISGGKTVSPQRRLALVESIRILLKHWPDDKEAAKYHFDLAWQCEKLTETAEPEKRQAWLREAISNYLKVPVDSPFHNEARFYALELSYQQLQEMPAGEAKLAKARELQTTLKQFGQEMRPQWQQEADKAKKNDLGRFGSTSEFHGEVIAYDILNQKDEALRRIETLPDRWPGTPVLREGSEFAIRSRLARGNVQQALGQFEAFRKKYGDTQAQGLMQVVVEKLREAILALSLQRGKDEQLKRFRDAYAAFAQQVYQSGIAKASPREKYYLTLLFADSLVQSGAPANASQALKLYEQLQGTDAKLREQANAKVRKEFAGLIRQAKAAKGKPAKMKAMKDKLADTIQIHDLQTWKSSFVQEANLLFAQLPKAKKNEKADLQDMAGRALVKAFQAVETRLLQQAPIDASVLMGMARCQEMRKQYPPALEKYGKLTQGLDPNTNSRDYWEAQLGYCRSFLAVYKSDPKKMVGLLQRVRSLRADAPQRWLGKLNLIEVEAEKIVQKARKP